MSDDGNFAGRAINPNGGFLMRNAARAAGGKAPDVTGYLFCAGIKFRLAGWSEVSREGKKYVSLRAELEKFQPLSPKAVREAQQVAAQSQQPAAVQQSQPAAKPAAVDEELPF